MEIAFQNSCRLCSIRERKTDMFTAFLLQLSKAFFFQQCAVVDNSNIVSQQGNLRKNVTGNQNGFSSCVAKLPNKRAYFCNTDRIETVDRFIQNQKFCFKTGYPEFSTYTLTVSDRLSKPNAWDLASLDYYFGEYGEKKHELMMKWTEKSWDDEYINSLFADIYGFGTLSPKDPNYIKWLAGWFAEQLEQENVERLQNKLDVWKESDTGKPVDFTPKEWGR